MENKVEEKEEKKPNLAQKLCYILGEVEGIPKNGFNSFHRYNFMREADVADAMRKLLSKYGVFVLPSVESVEASQVPTEKGGTQRFCHVKVKYTFINADDPSDKLETFHYGDSADSGSGDKALYKALTGCHKYFFIRTFSLGADEDVEDDGHKAQGRRDSDDSLASKGEKPASQPRGAAAPSQAPSIPGSNNTAGQAAPQGGTYKYSFPYKVHGVTEDDMKQIRQKMKAQAGAKFFGKKEGGDNCWYTEKVLTTADGYPAWLVASLVPDQKVPLLAQQDLGELIPGVSEHEQGEPIVGPAGDDNDLPWDNV